MIRQAKEFVEAVGILSIQNPKPGTMLKDDNEKIFSQFLDNEISRCMAGKKILHLKEHGKIFHKQKWLLLCNLTKAYSLF
jgi:hypothetical protein